MGLRLFPRSDPVDGTDRPGCEFITFTVGWDCGGCKSSESELTLPKTIWEDYIHLSSSSIFFNVSGI